MTDRLDNLKKMLRQVDPKLKAEGLSETLESRSAPGAENLTLDTRRVDPARMEAAMAFESLDRVANNQKVDAEQQFVLEAIVMPYHRPVVDIVDDQMKVDQLTTKWEHLGTDGLKSRIESCLLSVGRIQVPSLPSLPYAGTGFIVGDGVLMTNRHVAAIFAAGVGRSLQFQSGLDASVDFYREIGRTSSETLTVEEVLMIHPQWDMALLRVKGLPEKRKPLSLSTTDPSSLTDREVVVVGYPGYDPTGDDEFQRIQNRIFRGAYYVKRLQPGLLRSREQVESFKKLVEVVTHDSSTLGGNSGSAVLLIPNSATEPIQVVGLHFAGQYLVSNYAVSAHDLAQDSRVVDAGVKFEPTVAARDDIYDPIWNLISNQGAAKQETKSPVTNNNTQSHVDHSIQPLAAVPPTLPQFSAGTSTWTIPLQVSVTLGTPQLVTAPATIAAQPTQAEGLFGRQAPVLASTFMAKFSASSLAKTSFDWPAALSLALASKLSYSPKAAVESMARTTWKLDTCLFIEADDTQCFVASSGEAVVVAFRGTESTGDWLANLNVFGTSQPYGIVHRGFHTGFTVVKAQIEQELKRLPNRKVVLTGHSLGGALATIAAAEWQRIFPINAIYTYGQPAVGRGDFPAFMQKHYGKIFYRFVNNNDIVPLVPPGYQHVGMLYQLDGSGRLKARNESVAAGLGAEGPPTMSETEFDRLRATLLQQRAALRSDARTESLGAPVLEGPVFEGLFPSVSDHYMDAYLAKIAAIASA
ncbi:lipase family protein [Singulisphaera acidiphila]|uniref:Serine protease n=1 Tax=Singulisphaera acidiphila (strain ATCC BAA-1392 / DSM 18658 / VKM B-2454 / MOB10) TaxID=886293 RepID=L0DG87_SINAD|nr:trypsin-like peptidase domain-containing protein [Singulisphaera acidiphila]AGA28287.1 putative lipase [Singulisphaera acidiphila DSM 18658]